MRPRQQSRRKPRATLCASPTKRHFIWTPTSAWWVSFKKEDLRCRCSPCSCLSSFKTKVYADLDALILTMTAIEQGALVPNTTFQPSYCGLSSFEDPVPTPPTNGSLWSAKPKNTEK